MIKVQFDYQIFSMQRYGGISRYFAHIQQTLKESKEFDCNRGILYSNNYYLSDNKFLIPSVLGKRLSKSSIAKLNKAYSKHCIKRGDFDIFHPTFYNPYFILKLKKPMVITIHDMIHELLPEYFSQNDTAIFHKRKAIENAAHIIAISESTKKDIQHLYNIPDSKISVIYHGYYNNKDTSGESHCTSLKPFILFVGERARYKNFNRFITAIAPLLNSEPELELICAGGGPLGIAEQEFISMHKISNQVKQLSVTDSQLKMLYQQALVFVYPSLYEGFGLPVLEAFSNSCPVAVSDTSCFKEVGGKAVLYFNPYDTEEIRCAVQSIISNTELANRLRKQGVLQLKKFPEETSIQKTMELYKKVI